VHLHPWVGSGLRKISAGIALSPEARLREAVPEERRPELASRYVPPQTPMERKLAAIWSKVLRMDEVGVNEVGKTGIPADFVPALLFQVELA